MVEASRASQPHPPRAGATPGTRLPTLFIAAAAPAPMKRREMLTALDVLAVARELDARLKGAFVEKVHQLGPDDVLLKVNVKGQPGKSNLLLLGGQRAHVTAHEVEVPASPTPFAAGMRKRVSNAVIEAVEQVGFDRMLRFRLGKGPASFEILVELLPDGAVALLEGGVIELVAKPKVFKGRRVTPKVAYVAPSPNADPRAMDAAALAKAAGGGAVSRALARGAGLGPGLADEVLLRAGVDAKREAGALTGAEWAAVQGALHDIVREASEEASPRALLSGETMTEFSPVPLSRWAGAPTRPFGSMSELFDAYFGPYRPAGRAPKEGAPSAEEAELARLERVLAQQREADTAAAADVARTQAAAEAIYSNFQAIEALLGAAPRGTRGEALQEAALRAGLAGAEVEAAREGRAVRLTIAGPDGAAHRVEVALGASVVAAAQAYYEEAGRAKDKQKGAREAMAETERALGAARKRHARGEGERERARADVRRAKEAGVPPPPRKREWFERYRWMHTTDGHLVLAGRDAAGNDTVVKKYLKPGDRYAHADIHGAPSVVVKRNPGEGEIPTAAMEEACAFGAIHSRAWGSGAGEVAAYWVLPDQVSKTPESGEHLPRGAFIIRGKRNTVRHVAMRAAVGGLSMKAERKAVCGPVAAVVAHCDAAVLVGPGARKGTDVAKELALSLRVHPDEIARALPPGGCEVLGPVDLARPPGADAEE